LNATRNGHYYGPGKSSCQTIVRTPYRKKFRRELKLLKLLEYLYLDPTCNSNRQRKTYWFVLNKVLPELKFKLHDGPDRARLWELTTEIRDLLDTSRFLHSTKFVGPVDISTGFPRFYTK